MHSLSAVFFRMLPLIRFFDGSQDSRQFVSFLERATHSSSRFALALRVQVFLNTFLLSCPTSSENVSFLDRVFPVQLTAHEKAQLYVIAGTLLVISCNFPAEKMAFEIPSRSPKARARKKTKSCFNLCNRKSCHSGAISFSLLNTLAFEARDQNASTSKFGIRGYQILLDLRTYSI